MPSRDRLTDPSYTPGRKELGAVLESLLDGDEPTVKGAERALLSAGLASLEPAIARLGSANPAGRMRLVRLLGRIAQAKDDARIGEVLLRTLTDPEPRVARSAIVAIGKLPVERARAIGAETALVGQLACRAKAERRATIEALGKIGGGEALGALAAVVPSDDLELRLLDRAKLLISRSSVAVQDLDRVLLDVPLGRPCTVAVFHRRGLSDIVGRQLVGLAPSQADGLERRRMCDYHGTLGQLFQARSMLVPALILEPRCPGDESLFGRVVADAICQQGVLDLLERLTSTRPRLRFVLPHEGHQRALLWNISERISHQTDRVTAHPKAALWEVSVERIDRPRIYLVPKRFEDPRFIYRVRDISGASHPTIAAALAEVLEAGPTDVIWDPFVGSGLELIECAMRGPYRELIGTDNNSRSLEAANANVRAAKLERVRLLNADARTAELRGVTRIVTNPPLGIRHQRDAQLAELLAEFLKNARRILAPSGRLVWLSPLPLRTAQLGERLGFEVERRGVVDVGGLLPELQVMHLGRVGRGRR
jgi:precorrin-6B methylase 2